MLLIKPYLYQKHPIKSFTHDAAAAGGGNGNVVAAECQSVSHSGNFEAAHCVPKMIIIN